MRPFCRRRSTSKANWRVQRIGWQAWAHISALFICASLAIGIVSGHPLAPGQSGHNRLGITPTIRIFAATAEYS